MDVLSVRVQFGYCYWFETACLNKKTLPCGFGFILVVRFSQFTLKWQINDLRKVSMILINNGN